MTPAQAPYDVKANYEKREVMIPMRDGMKLFTIIYTPRSATERYPMLMTRTAYGIRPYGPDAYRASIGPNNEFAKEGYIFVYQDTRGKFKSEGEFIHHVPFVKGSTKPNESTDTCDTIDWLVKNVPNNNGRVGQWGISWAGWEVSHGHDRRAPGAEGVVAAGAAAGSVPRRRLSLRRRVSADVRASTGCRPNARARNAPSERAAERFDYGTPDGYRFFLELGAAANAQQVFRRRGADLERLHDARHLRRVLAVAQRAEGSRRHHHPGADRRRAGSTRRISTVRSACIARIEGEESRRTRPRWSSARGCTAAGRASDGDTLGNIASASKTGRVLPHERRAAVLQLST